MVNVKNGSLSITEKQEMLFRVLEVTNVVPNNMKEKIEGIIIGVSLREQMEREQLGGVNNG